MSNGYVMRAGGVQEMEQNAQTKHNNNLTYAISIVMQILLNKYNWRICFALFHRFYSIDIP